MELTDIIRKTTEKLFKKAPMVRVEYHPRPDLGKTYFEIRRYDGSTNKELFKNNIEGKRYLARMVPKF